MYGLLGRNGAGKVDLIKMLLGMVQPDSGRATLLGDDSRSLRSGHPGAHRLSGRGASAVPLDDAWGRRSIHARRFTPHWHDALSGRDPRTLRDFAKAKIRPALERPAGPGFAGLGRGTDPELLILDDPTLGLDTVVRRDFLESMIQLIQRSGRTILFSSHILGDVERVADRIGVMVDGVLRVDCPTEHFKSSLRRVVLEFTGTVPPLSAVSGAGQPAAERRQARSWSSSATARSTRRWPSGLGPASVEVLEMNLEDAFIAYTRGGTAPPLAEIEREVAPC